MEITDTGQVRAKLQELLSLRTKHLFSAADIEADDRGPRERCGTPTTLTGYTEWVGDTELPISIGWDWRIEAHNPTVLWRRDDLPRTNVQLVDEHDQPLAWKDNLTVLATWVDALPWSAQVAYAIAANSKAHKQLHP